MSALVDRTGVAAATIRYYFSEGLLPPARRAASNRFLYDERHVEVIRLIRLLQERRGLSLETIGRLLPDLLPDLTGQEDGGVFRPEMWGQLLAVHFPPAPTPSPGDRLVEAGLAAFSRHGYSDVSVDDVCRTAAIAKGSFYRYFSSKEELFFAVAAAVGQNAAAAMRTQAESERLSVDLASDLVAQVLGPHLVVVLDLASLAVQRRPGHGRVIRSLMAMLHTAADDLLLPVDSNGDRGESAKVRSRGRTQAEEVVDVGIARALAIGVTPSAVATVLDDLREAEQAG
jgi:AcrR family transcriptional regulator